MFSGVSGIERAGRSYSQFIAVHNSIEHYAAEIQFRRSCPVINFIQSRNSGNSHGTFCNRNRCGAGKFIITGCRDFIINDLNPRVRKSRIGFRIRFAIRTVSYRRAGRHVRYGNAVGLFVVSYGYVFRFCAHARADNFPFHGRGTRIISFARNGNRISAGISSLRCAVRIDAVIRFRQRGSIQRDGVHTYALFRSGIVQRMRGK